jgi:hypothetical protein
MKPLASAACLRAGAALALTLAGCQVAPTAPGTPPPRACGLAEFENAPGLPLPSPEARKPGSKSEPLKTATNIPVNGGIGDIGRWVDAAPGWKAWRLWLRSEEARSLSVHLKPLLLPAGAELWLCSPDGAVRKGPTYGAGPNASGQYWSPAVPGNELWIEVLAPADRAGEVQLTIVSAFAGLR